MNIENLFKKYLKNFKPYIPSPTIEQISSEVGIPVTKIIKLDTGENPYVERFQNKDLFKGIKLYSYPDPLCLTLRKKLSAYTGYDPEWIMCGNGSDELIDLLIRAFVSTKEEIIVSPPTFPMYEFFGRLSGAKIRDVLRKNDLTLNSKNIVKSISSKTKIVFIDSPGNPTGDVITQAQTKKLLEKQIFVVVDEAYFEYCGKTVLPLVKKYPNLVVLRTFSKWAGLSGLRVGYVIANPNIIKVLLSIKAPYNVNCAAQIMACSALDRKEKILKELKKVIILRDLLINKLSKLPVKVFPSQGAYVLFQPKVKAENIQKFMRLNGVLVKIINQPVLENCLRVNLGKQREINKLIKLLKVLL